MHAMLDEMKDIEVVEPVVTIRSRMKESDIPLIGDMVCALMA